MTTGVKAIIDAHLVGDPTVHALTVIQLIYVFNKYMYCVLTYTILRISATLGTPAAFIPKSIQKPGIATPVPGICTMGLLAKQTEVEGPQSSSRRWSVLVECVDPPMRIIDTIERGSDDVTVITSPGPAANIKIC
jgi:hypothetical protein